MRKIVVIICSPDFVRFLLVFCEVTFLCTLVDGKCFL
jgi:hypothetical protein